MTAGTRERILGIEFFKGTAEEAVVCASAAGLVVAPSGTCFERFMRDGDYRRAILSADIVLPDSGLMVSLWRVLRQRRIQRISGLAYLQRLLRNPQLEFRDVLWVLPNERSREKLLAWAKENGRAILPNECYIAPIYGSDVRDAILLQKAESQRATHIVIAVGAGAQEKLGWFLRENLSHRPAIHCVGGALGFVTGDQVAIPQWADEFYLGWFLRLLSQPKVFIPRLWKARLLPWLILKYGARLPPMQSGGDRNSCELKLTKRK